MEKYILQFKAPWCGPCKMMQPMIDEVNKKGELTIKQVDVEENPDLATKYDIRTVPSFIFIKDNQEVSRLKGVQTEKILKQTFENM